MNQSEMKTSVKYTQTDTTIGYCQRRHDITFQLLIFAAVLFIFFVLFGGTLMSDKLINGLLCQTCLWSLTAMYYSGELNQFHCHTW